MLGKPRFIVLLAVLAVGISAFVSPAVGDSPRPKASKFVKENFCKDGAYREFFKNQGACIAWVNRFYNDPGGGYSGLRDGGTPPKR